VVPDDRPLPLAAYVLGRAPAGITVRGPRPGVTLSYANAAARDAYAIGRAPAPGPPPGGRLVPLDRAWVATARC
jgi:hypothetical protein